jgi:hypothetical protein
MTLSLLTRHGYGLLVLAVEITEPFGCLQPIVYDFCGPPMYAACEASLTITTELPTVARQLRLKDSSELPAWKLA